MYNTSKPFNEQIRGLIKSTHPKQGPIRLSRFGKRFKVYRDQGYWKDFSELTCTDGIGTKGLLHWKMNTLHYGVQDAFAMVVDDLIEGGFVPVMLQNHVQMQEEKESKIFTVIKSLVELAKTNKWRYAEKRFNPIIISGGETAIIDTLQGFEMGITATGYAKKNQEIGSNAKYGDVIIGLGSSGVHSNGLSFFRDELFAKRNMSLDAELPSGITMGEELTKPTNVYLPAIKAMIDSFAEKKEIMANSVIHGMVHITGGGLSKLKELTPDRKTDIVVHADHSLKPQEIFRYAYEELGVPSQKMYARFNNGIGYVIAIAPEASKYALAVLRKHFKADEIGYARRGKGKVMIESEYEPIVVEYE